jgi:hypothetical protein
MAKALSGSLNREVASASNVTPGAAANTRHEHSVQVHLRLRAADAQLLRDLAIEWDQTQSAVIRTLLKPFRNSRTNGEALR